MAGYTKLHSLILDSSIWLESTDVRIIWITMLAMADKDGIVQASVGGLAARARVSRDTCVEALAILAGPDPDSRDGTTGERIENTEGGWVLLNHANYRDKQTRQQRLTAERVKRHRERQRLADEACVTGDDVTLRNAPKRGSASASASASVPASESSGTTPSKPESVPKSIHAPPKLAVRPDDVALELWQAFKANRSAKKKPLTTMAWSLIANRIEKSGVTATAALTEAVENGWADWKPASEWPRNRAGPVSANGNRGRMPHTGFADKDYGESGLI